MGITAKDRPIGAVREETIDRLIANYGHGRLSLEAFERRLDQALEADSHESLSALTDDLEPLADKAFAAQKSRDFGVDAAAQERDDGDFFINVFSGTTRRGAWVVPSRLSALNIFGGAELDFSNARLSSATTRMRVFCLFGGVHIYVPEQFKTVSKMVCIFGGVDDRAPPVSEPDAPTLVIEGLALFGGVTVRLRKTLRQRLIEFAEAVKAMFKPAY